MDLLGDKNQDMTLEQVGCLAGLNTVKKLGLSTALPVTLKMHAAEAAILGTSSKGEAVSTRHITKHTDKIFLSREACTDLGIISSRRYNGTQSRRLHRCHEYNPTRLSLPKKDKATTDPHNACHRGEQLEQYLLDTYHPSTFNTCEHQTLPLMEGPPMIDPQATPTAHHTPIPVPLHWQDEVKAGLDRDVRPGTGTNRCTSHVVSQNGQETEENH